MTTICAKCLALTLNYIQDGHDERGRKFKLYICKTCNNYTRDFNLTERETVEEEIAKESLVPKALSGNLRQLKLGLKVRVPD